MPKNRAMRVRLMHDGPDIETILWFNQVPVIFLINLPDPPASEFLDTLLELINTSVCFH